jgi:undecaprenyl-diphosphatase
LLAVARIFTALGEPVVLIAAGVLVLLWLWRIGRGRLELVKTSSFPSGHAASSMIFYTTMALALTTGTRLHRAAVAGAILLSLMVGTSRVMLGVHWPSDVIGGWSFGLLWALISLPIAERLFRADSATPAKRL